eukprot:m.483885 g.483885  ORF g.483885 m.483885 type:complete len:582 (+) comp23110_c0_seq1:125-1870(+)
MTRKTTKNKKLQLGHHVSKPKRLPTNETPTQKQLCKQQQTANPSTIRVVEHTLCAVVTLCTKKKSKKMNHPLCTTLDHCLSSSSSEDDSESPSSSSLTICLTAGSTGCHVPSPSGFFRTSETWLLSSMPTCLRKAIISSSVKPSSLSSSSATPSQPKRLRKRSSASRDWESSLSSAERGCWMGWGGEATLVVASGTVAGGCSMSTAGLLSRGGCKEAEAPRAGVDICTAWLPALGLTRDRPGGAPRGRVRCAAGGADVPPGAPVPLLVLRLVVLVVRPPSPPVPGTEPLSPLVGLPPVLRLCKNSSLDDRGLVAPLACLRLANGACFAAGWVELCRGVMPVRVSPQLTSLGRCLGWSCCWDAEGWRVPGPPPPMWGPCDQMPPFDCDCDADDGRAGRAIVRTPVGALARIGCPRPARAVDESDGKSVTGPRAACGSDGRRLWAMALPAEPPLPTPAAIIPLPEALPTPRPRPVVAVVPVAASSPNDSHFGASESILTAARARGGAYCAATVAHVGNRSYWAFFALFVRFGRSPVERERTASCYVGGSASGLAKGFRDARRTGRTSLFPLPAQQPNLTCLCQ